MLAPWVPLQPIMGAMAAGLATIGAIIMPIIMGAGAGAAPPFRDSLLGSSTVSTTCTIACRDHGSCYRNVSRQALLGGGSTMSTMPRSVALLGRMPMCTTCTFTSPCEGHGVTERTVCIPSLQLRCACACDDQACKASANCGFSRAFNACMKLSLLRGQLASA